MIETRSRFDTLSPSTGRGELQHLLSSCWAGTQFWHSLELTINHTWKLSNVGQINNYVVYLAASPSGQTLQSINQPNKSCANEKYLPPTLQEVADVVISFRHQMERLSNDLLLHVFSLHQTKQNENGFHTNTVHHENWYEWLSSLIKHHRTIWTFLFIYFFEQIALASRITYQWKCS